MINILRKLMILGSFLFVISLFTTPRAIAYWDNPLLNDTGNAVTVGPWNFYEAIVDDYVDEVGDYIDEQINVNGDTDFEWIYTQTDMDANQWLTVEDIPIAGYLWDIEGKVKNANLPTLGYISVIDRELDVLNNPIHDINTQYFTSPPFPEYNYFTSYDVMNSNTNNRISFRLNYNSRMNTGSPISGLTNVSFYAALGLEDPDDLLPIRRQNFVVEISTDGITWIKLTSKKPPLTTTDPFDFRFYSVDVPAEYLGQDLYLQIRFNGRARTIDTIDSYSRLVIDDLTINTN